MASAFAAAPNSDLSWPRFPSPLIEPDFRISRIRLYAPEGEKHSPSITATSAFLARNGSAAGVSRLPLSGT